MTAPTETHHEVVDITNPDRRPRVLMVVANPGVSTTLGWPVGFWAAELFHLYYEFIQKRYDVTIASPDGGRVEADAMNGSMIRARALPCGRYASRLRVNRSL